MRLPHFFFTLKTETRVIEMPVGIQPFLRLGWSLTVSYNELDSPGESIYHSNEGFRCLPL